MVRSKHFTPASEYMVTYTIARQVTDSHILSDCKSVNQKIQVRKRPLHIVVGAGAFQNKKWFYFWLVLFVGGGSNKKIKCVFGISCHYTTWSNLSFLNEQFCVLIHANKYFCGGLTKYAYDTFSHLPPTHTIILSPSKSHWEIIDNFHQNILTLKYCLTKVCILNALHPYLRQKHWPKTLL